MRHTPVLLSSILFLSLLGGCIGSTDEDLGSSSIAPGSLLAAKVALMEEGGYTVEVPQDVYLVGFEPGMGALLQAELEPEEVHHEPFSFTRAFPPDPSDPQEPLSGASYPNPTITTAVFRVTQLDETLAGSILDAFAGMTVEDADGILDANAAEQKLAEALPAAGYAIDPNRPVFVIVHGGDTLGEHAWRYTYNYGYLQPVRTFGELTPILVTDVSALPDPYVTGSPDMLSPVTGDEAGGKKYDYPLEAGGEETLAALEELVIDSVHYRFMKGPIYPLTTKPCHHVTLILAVHTTSLTQYLPGFRTPEEWVDVDALTGAFTNLTGDPVHVELKVLRQPQDDPALDALARGAGLFVTLDALRWYIDENWEKFVTPMPECEEYLSLLIFGDLAQKGAFGGIGMYDVERSHRISFSLVPDDRRLQDPSGELRKPIEGGDPSRFEPNQVNRLFSHETGHLFGQHHPQHLSKVGDPSPALDTFQSVWSSMSYQTGDRTIDFGLNDRAPWQRNRLGYAFAEMQASGLADSPEVQEALKHAGMFHWDAAYDYLAPVLKTAEPAAEEEFSWLYDYDIVDWHDHPWFDDDLVVDPADGVFGLVR